jgi:hypothetical protein
MLQYSLWSTCSPSSSASRAVVVLICVVIALESSILNFRTMSLVLRLNQETVYDFILLFMPPCGPHLTPLATGSLERSLLVFSTPGGLTGDDLSRLFFTCTNTSQAATCTCNTYPRISQHNVVNHSSHKVVTIHRSLNHTWSSP